MKLSRKVSASQRFWARVERTKTCWLWIGPLSIKGYGYLKVSGHTIGAHRFSWILHNGEIPKGLYVCHHCDNPRCVNPSHLWLGTNHENILDSTAKGRRAIQRGARNNNAKLTSREVLEIRRLIERNVPRRSVAKEFNISPSHVSNLVANRSWAKLTSE